MNIIATIIGIALGGGTFFLWNINPAPSPSPSLSIDFARVAPAFILPVSQTTYVPVRDFGIPDPEIQARAAVLVDANSGRVLYDRASRTRLPIASITKLMTAMVVLDQLDLNASYSATPEDLNVDGNGADLLVSEKFRGIELLRLMLIASSNDAASVFSTSARNQGIDIVVAMNEKSRALGMTETHFEDPAGLHDQGTYSTAFDVALLVKAAAKYKLIGEILNMKTADIDSSHRKGRHIIATNQLLNSISGIVLGKTGNTTGALGTMALYVEVGTSGDGLISVVLGSEDRFGDTTTIINWGKRAHIWN